jgi:hypothetical protein
VPERIRQADKRTTDRYRTITPEQQAAKIPGALFGDDFWRQAAAFGDGDCSRSSKKEWRVSYLAAYKATLARRTHDRRVKYKPEEWDEEESAG